MNEQKKSPYIDVEDVVDLLYRLGVSPRKGATVSLYGFIGLYKCYASEVDVDTNQRDE
jgi:hypothetical protein